MEFEFAIIIPVHNGAKRIHIPLEALAEGNPGASGVELVVVDNASTDGTGEAARRCPAWERLRALGWSCRVVREENKGLTHARLRGIRETTGALVGFLDDDNAPEPGYLGIVQESFADERVGAVISRVSLACEVAPPPAVARRQHLLAANELLGDQVIDWGPEVRAAPTLGAGLWMRRQALAKAVPVDVPEALLSDRTGRQLAGSGDIEIGERIGRAGYVRRYQPRLRLRHHIPRGRQETGYFMRLIVGTVRGELTMQQRYGLRAFGVGERIRSVTAMLIALAALPVLFARVDGRREALFVLADRWARCCGPY